MEVQIIFVKLFKEEAKDFIVAEIMPFIEVILRNFILFYSILCYAVLSYSMLSCTIVYYLALRVLSSPNLSLLRYFFDKHPPTLPLHVKLNIISTLFQSYSLCECLSNIPTKTFYSTSSYLYLPPSINAC